MSDSQQQPSPASAAAPLLSRAGWARVLPFLAYIFFIFVVDMLGRVGVSADALRWMYPVKIVVVTLILLKFWSEYSELKSLRVSPIGMVSAVAIGVGVFYLWIALNASWMIIGTPDGYDPRTNGQLDWLMVAVRIAGAALVVPVMEELFWRSFLMRWIDDVNFITVDPRAVKPLSVLITVVLFAFEHNQWLAGIVAGLAYSLLYMKTRNLWLAILAHAVTNGVLGVWIVRTGMWAYW